MMSSCETYAFFVQRTSPSCWCLSTLILWMTCSVVVVKYSTLAFCDLFNWQLCELLCCRVVCQLSVRVFLFTWKLLSVECKRECWILYVIVWMTLQFDLVDRPVVISEASYDVYLRWFIGIVASWILSMHTEILIFLLDFRLSST